MLEPFEKEKKRRRNTEVGIGTYCLNSCSSDPWTNYTFSFVNTCWRNKITVVKQIWCYSSMVRIANPKKFNSLALWMESIVYSCLHVRSNKHMQIQFYTWRLCLLPIYFFWTSNPSFFALLCDTAAGPWKHFFFASGAMLRHWRDARKWLVFQVPSALLFLLLQYRELSPAGHSPANELQWFTRGIFPENHSSALKRGFRMAFASTSLALSCLPAPSCSPLANFSTICPPFFPNKVWVSTLVGVGERLLKVFLLEYLVLFLEVVASPLFLNSLGFFLFLNC